MENLNKDYIRTARAKGLPEGRVLWKHLLRNSILPVINYLAPATAYILTGTLVVERIFNIPGMGRYFVEAATNRDYNLVMGVMLVYGFLLMLFNAIVDVAYAFIDPRVELR